MFRLNWRKKMLTGFARLPWSWLYAWSTVVSWILYYIIPYRKKVVLDNLKLAFPEKTDWERRQIARDFYRNLTDIVIESLKSYRLSEAEARKRISLDDQAGLADLYDQGRGVMLVMGHYTNFEWTAMCLQLFVPQQTYAVYHPIKNERLNSYLVAVRQKFGMTLFKMKDTYPFMLNQKDKRPLYIFMADQSPHRGKIKYAGPFFHPFTPVHLGVENLAKKLDLAVVFLVTERVGRGKYVMRTELLRADPASTAPFEITRLHMKRLEEKIRQQPASWMWSHKRWKNVETAEEVMKQKSI